MIRIVSGLCCFRDFFQKCRAGDRGYNQGKNVWKMNFFQVREKSGNLVIGQSNLKVLEMSGKVQVSYQTYLVYALLQILIPANNAAEMFNACPAIDLVSPFI